MKNLLKPLTLILVLSILLSGCKKDEEPAPKKNYMTYKDTEYDLSSGFLVEFGGSSTTGYNFDLYLLSSGLSVSLTDFITGTGEVLYFELWSSASSGLENGTYTFSNTEAPNKYTTFEALINYNSTDQTVDEDVVDGTGNVTVKVDGQTYTIDFDITTPSGNIKGNYTGTLEKF